MMIKGKKMRLWYSKTRPRANALNLMLESLNLRYSTWLFKSGWARKAVMPRACYDEEVILHPFIRLGET